LSNQYPALFEEGFSWLSTSLDLKPWDHFLWGYFKDRLLQKNLSTSLELKTATQSETEAISTETLTKVLSNFVLRLHKVCEPRYNMWKMF
jgi:hypothetical protein